MTTSKYYTDVGQLTMITEPERARLKQMTDTFPFRMNDYYMKLANWNDPGDPIRRLVIPGRAELLEHELQAAGDANRYSVVPGVRHKYETTAQLMVAEVCNPYCRYCFRKHLLRKNPNDGLSDVEPGLRYISEHPEIDTVWLTGGDGLALPAERLRYILGKLRDMEHVNIIRLGTKLPIFDPLRICEAMELLDAIHDYSTPDKRIYIMAHIHHPKEITPESKRAFRALHDAGAILVNHTTLLQGINDRAEVLSELLDKLTWAGLSPDYFSVNRPVPAHSEGGLTLQKIYRIVEKAKSRTSGLGKRVRLSMSHATGKIEILAIENGKAYLKYYESHQGDPGRFMIMECPEHAEWFDDLIPEGKAKLKQENAIG
ncbi:KamA family radical SAM protein [Paenibacillus gansuensis]|uniref:KamA family radical SAM protein n=1 Tax=Paenibacillus gansuensis TaxID=306542 RepID=A0ABW5PJF9_9BACL